MNIPRVSRAQENAGKFPTRPQGIQRQLKFIDT